MTKSATYSKDYRATPRISVRIDRGEDWVELCGDWQEKYPPLCGEGDVESWCDLDRVRDAYYKLNEAVME